MLWKYLGMKTICIEDLYLFASVLESKWSYLEVIYILVSGVSICPGIESNLFDQSTPNSVEPFILNGPYNRCRYTS